MTILVVDDEKALLDLATAVLEKQGYRVLGAISGTQALQLWEEHAPEIGLLLTDMVLPDGANVRDLSEKMQAAKPALKTIFSSVFSRKMMDEVFHFPGPIRFLHKPYAPKQLVEAVHAALNDNSNGRTGDPVESP